MTAFRHPARWFALCATLCALGAALDPAAHSAPAPQTAPSAVSGREGKTPLERTDHFLAESRFRRLPTLNAKGEDTVFARNGVRLDYELADEGAPGTEDDLIEQLQGIVLAARFAQTPEESEEVRDLARRFSIIWSGSTNEYLAERRVSLGRAIEQLLTRRVARIRVAARAELARLVSERRGDFRRQFHLTRGDLEEQVTQVRGVLRDQWHRSLHQLAATVREQTHTFHASSFEELERVYWEERRGCRPGAPFDTYHRRLERAEQSIGEIRGRTVFELLAAVSVPRQSMEASVRQAEDGSDRALQTALESLGTVESEVDAYLDAKLAEYTRDLDGVITLPSSAPSTDDLLQLSKRVGGLLESAATSMVSTMRTRWMSKPRSILDDLERALRTERRTLLQALRTEVNSFEETVVARVRGTKLEVDENVRAAQRDFRAFGNEYALLRRADLAKPLEGLPLAASHTSLGYELESGLRLSFAKKWIEQRGEDLDRQFRLIALLHRFTRADGVNHDAVRQVVDRFNTVWTRSDVSRRDVKKLEERIATLLGKASPLAKQGAIVGIESEIIAARITWRRAYTQAVANLRATAAQSANSELTGTPTEAVRLQQVVAHEAGLLIQLRQELLGSSSVRTGMRVRRGRPPTAPRRAVPRRRSNGTRWRAPRSKSCSKQPSRSSNAEVRSDSSRPARRSPAGNKRAGSPSPKRSTPSPPSTTPSNNAPPPRATQRSETSSRRGTKCRIRRPTSSTNSSPPSATFASEWELPSRAAAPGPISQTSRQPPSQTRSPGVRPRPPPRVRTIHGIPPRRTPGRSALHPPRSHPRPPQPLNPHTHRVAKKPALAGRHPAPAWQRRASRSRGETSGHHGWERLRQ